ncbi:signal transduction response regulator receiver domain [Janthinobacterium sp. HH01]|uniref:response regulator n=1 Tax=Janthinobacterium sp. HH01 TaxID=1198452 RepID=UPI0002AEBB53|nr:response regulator [Janthinobacterium sp. HH01]ELX12062.1 signal transduction response regulator receiver domain [Janthinobacterium sp. HH01]
MPALNIDLSLPLLVVDDNQQMRSVVKGILADLGFVNVFLAGSGEEACRILNERPIAAVIADLDMPGMSGLQLLQWVRANLADAELPFMLLPSEANREGLRAAAQAGVTDCLIKPFTLATFHSKLQAMFQSRGDAAVKRAAVRRAAMPAAPATAAPAPAPLIGLERPLEERLREATVLVVDDIATNIKVIAGMLAEDGYGVKVAISGKKALEIIPVHRPDIILLDVMMPEMDGFEVCRRLKADPATADIPVIFLSAKDQAEDIIGGLELGAVDYVTKPVDPAILKARLRTHLRLAGMMAELRRQNAAVADNAHLREEVERLSRYDLAAPLAEVLEASAQLLADAALAPPQRERMAALDEAARRALRLTSLSLELCRIEQGASRPHAAPVALNPLLARATMAVAASHPVMLPAQPATLLANGTLCHMLFEQLALNAAAHTPAGTSIVLGATLDGGHWALTLEYAGVLPAAQRACLQGQAERPDHEQTLPMYAARLLAQVQGGTLSAQDDSARSRLLLRLPAA